MSRTGTLILLGILTILTPFSGLPATLRSFLAVIFGTCVVIIGVAMRAHETRVQRQSIEPAQPSTPAEPTVSEPAAPSSVSPI